MINVKEAFPEFGKPSIAIDTVILRVKDTDIESNRQVSNKQLQVLLVKKPTEDKWHLPGTILRLGETPEDAFNRIANNKVNLDDTKFEQLYTVADNPLRDERGHIISIVYIGMTNSITNIAKDMSNSEYETQWFWVGRANKEDNNSRCYIGEDSEESFKNMMYDHHIIVADTINRLKGKLFYTDIGFNFVDKLFTFKILENTFIAINERNIPGFRRSIGNKVEGTGKMSDGKAFRPAELYRKKE